MTVSPTARLHPLPASQAAEQPAPPPNHLLAGVPVITVRAPPPPNMESNPK